MLAGDRQAPLRGQTLDLLRLVAVAAVFFFHYVLGTVVARWTAGRPSVDGQPRAVRLPGVLVFFIISGFVIAYSAEGRTAAGFVIARSAASTRRFCSA